MIICQAFVRSAPGVFLNILAAEKRRRSDRVHSSSNLLSGHDSFFRDAGQFQLKMQHGARAGTDNDVLLCLLEVGHSDGDRVFA